MYEQAVGCYKVGELVFHYEAVRCKLENHRDAGISVKKMAVTLVFS